MQRRCKTCGATLEQDTFSCPSCGSLPDSHTNDVSFFARCRPNLPSPITRKDFISQTSLPLEYFTNLSENQSSNLSPMANL